MSYNLVDPTTGDLTRVAGNSNIVDTAIKTDSTWSSKKISDELNKKVSSTEVAHIKRFDSVPGNDWNNAIEEGYYSIPIDVVANTIANRPFDFAIQVRVIKSDTNDLYYVYQIAYVSSNDSRIYIRKQNGEGAWTSWQQLATMDKVAHEVDTSYMSNGVLNISSIRQALGVGCYEIMGQGTSGHGSIRLNMWQIFSGSIAFSCCITDSSGVRSICSNEGESPTVDVGTSYFAATDKIIKIF